MSEDPNRNYANKARIEREREANKGSQRAAKVAGAGRSVGSPARDAARTRGRQIF